MATRFDGDWRSEHSGAPVKRQRRELQATDSSEPFASIALLEPARWPPHPMRKNLRDYADNRSNDVLLLEFSSS